MFGLPPVETRIPGAGRSSAPQKIHPKGHSSQCEPATVASYIGLNLECLSYVAWTFTAILVTENNDGKDVWRAKTQFLFTFSGSDLMCPKKLQIIVTLQLWDNRLVLDVCSFNRSSWSKTIRTGD